MFQEYDVEKAIQEFRKIEEKYGDLTAIDNFVADLYSYISANGKFVKTGYYDKADKLDKICQSIIWQVMNGVGIGGQPYFDTIYESFSCYRKAQDVISV